MGLRYKCILAARRAVAFCFPVQMYFHGGPRHSASQAWGQAYTLSLQLRPQACCSGFPSIPFLLSRKRTFKYYARKSMISEPRCVSTATQCPGGRPRLTHLRGQPLPLLDNMKGVGLSQISKDQRLSHGKDLVDGFHSTSP